MSARQNGIPSSQIIEGLQIAVRFSADAVRSAIRYQPRDDDVFLVSYPKCGQTWTQQILLLIFRQGVPVESHDKIQIISPYLELTGAKGAETMTRPGNIRIHLPFHLTPWNARAKYIYVVRNPKDTCVSYYHHLKQMPGQPFDGTFNHFFDLFITGNVDYGDYFDHLLGWYEHRNDPNVLFVTYEEMKANPEAAILKMASFIDDKLYAEPLRQDPEKLKNVVKFSSFDYMKEYVGKGFEKITKMSKEDMMKSDFPEEMKKAFVNADWSKFNSTESKVNNFVRKGITGGWKSYLSEDQNRRMDEKVAQRLKGTDILNFWKEYM